jgi:glycerophosphoryl diester phosphodiesterase
VTAALALAAVAVACSGDDDDETASTITSAAPSSTTATTTPPSDAPATVIAHRGASGQAPEHTFAAYDLAVEQGADFIEQDLQLTADGVLVVLHDDTLDRTARGPAESCTGPVASKTLAQLRQCEVGSWFNEANPALAEPGYEGLPIPTLAEVVARYGTDVRYYIETKSPEAQPGMEEALLAVLEDAGLIDAGSRADLTTAPVVIQSFSAASLRLVHDLRPELPLVQLVTVGAEDPLGPAQLDDIAGYAVGIGPLSALVDAAVVAAAHERCLAVHPWTVDDQAELGRLFGLGVDGVFTNLPTVATEVRAEHPAPTPLCARDRP